MYNIQRCIKVVYSNCLDEQMVNTYATACTFMYGKSEVQFLVQPNLSECSNGMPLLQYIHN